jgi:hypothetical protein
VEGRFVEEDVLYPWRFCIYGRFVKRMFCREGRYVEGRFVDGRFMEGRYVEGRFVDGRFMEGRFVEGRFALVPIFCVIYGKCINGP